jgi:DNA-binding SARP family transcriptional activator/class 3 adenylate cyclase
VETQVHDLERFDRMRRFLSPQIADLVLNDDNRSLLEPHRQDIAVLFCDLRGFTAASNASEPEELLAALGEFHSLLGELVARYDATVGYFAGDGVMAFFNDPMPCAHPSLTAVQMAIDMRDQMSDVLARWRRRGYELGVGMGIARGFSTLGTIGFDGRHDYTAIGAVVNLASRLCAEAADGEILISQRATAELEEQAELKELAPLALRGFADPIPAWSVVRVATSKPVARAEPAVQPGTDLEFRILGPLELIVGGQPVELRPGKERALLALLLMNANRVVTADELIAGLWPDPPPDSALTGLRVYVYRLRRALASAGLSEVLTTQSGGYLLALGSARFDATTFEERLASGRDRLAAGDALAASADFRQALALWRGPALAEVADADFARAEAARLDEARLCALEDRNVADLACGRHVALIPDLDDLVARHPFRERFWAQRMLALYRAGRQAEALAAYQEVRRLLDDELGLEPSPELSRLEQQILKHDAALDWAASGAAT